MKEDNIIKEFTIRAFSYNDDKGKYEMYTIEAITVEDAIKEVKKILSAKHSGGTLMDRFTIMKVKEKNNKK